jgi:membrane-bound lytic murein transglycosylase A
MIGPEPGENRIERAIGVGDFIETVASGLIVSVSIGVMEEQQTPIASPNAGPGRVSRQAQGVKAVIEIGGNHPVVCTPRVRPPEVNRARMRPTRALDKVPRFRSRTAGFGPGFLVDYTRGLPRPHRSSAEPCGRGIHGTAGTRTLSPPFPGATIASVEVAPRRLFDWKEPDMSRRLRVGVLGVALAWAAGCQKPEAAMEPFEPEKDYSHPLPPGELALRKLASPADYPDFSRAFYGRAGLEEAIHHSLAYLAKPSSQKYFPYGDVSHDRAVASLQVFLEVLHEAETPAELNDAIRDQFEVYQSVGCDDQGTVYYTGYYCPIFDGRRDRDERFRYPLYGLPPDLVKDEEGRTLGRRGPDGSLDTYDTRRGIEESGRLKGLEIAWLADPFEAYVVTVQGSAKLRLEDGSLYELGYAGNNGHEYTSVGRALVADGHIPADELSLQAMIQFFRNHPEEVRPYCWRNDRYVFFREAPGGPFGSINVPVTPFRTVATDKEIFPRACLAFVDTYLPSRVEGQVRSAPFRAFMLDQDTGGAIRAAGKCDVFMGVGPDAEALAGRTGHEGTLYYLFVRTDRMPGLEPLDGG